MNVPLRFTDMYLDDSLGFKEMHKNGKLKFYTGIGDHMHVHDYHMTQLVAPMLLDE